MPNIFLRLILALTASLLVSSLSAHDFWIEPDEFMPVPDTEVAISLRQGVEFKGDTLPYIPDWFEDFSQLSNDGRMPVLSLVGDDPAATLVPEPGPLLLGYQSERSFVELDADKFNQYLDHEGIEYLREQRRARGEDDKPAPEYFVRCAKTLLQSGDVQSDADTDIYKQVLGYTLELIPEANPYRLTAGDQLTFSLLLRNKPAEGLLLQAFTRDQPELIQKIRIDVDGHGTVNLDRPGIWFVKAVSIEPVAGDPQALWESFWASYLFELPAAETVSD